MKKYRLYLLSITVIQLIGVILTGVGITGGIPIVLNLVGVVSALYSFRRQPSLTTGTVVLLATIELYSGSMLIGVILLTLNLLDILKELRQ